MVFSQAGGVREYGIALADNTLAIAMKTTHSVGGGLSDWKGFAFDVVDNGLELKSAVCAAANSVRVRLQCIISIMYTSGNIFKRFLWPCKLLLDNPFNSQLQAKDDFSGYG